MVSQIYDRKAGLSSAAAYKGPVAVATTANIVLAGQQTIDGVAVTTGTRVLVKNQSDARQNGIRICDTGDWPRAADFSRNDDVVTGTRVVVTGGSTQAGSYQVSTAAINFDTSTIDFISAPIFDVAGVPNATAGIRDELVVNIVGQTARTRATRTTPYDFGADGEGDVDSKLALNSMFTKIRNEAIASGYAYVNTHVDMGGGELLVSGPVNVTGIQAWNLDIHNGSIVGNGTGKPVLDLTGSRGYSISNLSVKGDQTNMPTLPFLCARATSQFGYCDNNIFENVSTNGYFSVAAHYAYAQETTMHSHCRYWNYNHDAHVAILEGYPTHPQTSDYKTIVSSGQSFINCKYTNVDFRYLPSGKSATATAITKANPAVVTVASHPFVNGDIVIVATAGGMTQINALTATIANATATTFQLSGINSSGFSTYTGGGNIIKKATKPALYMNRMLQHSFDNCYIVAYGDDAVEFGFPDNRPFEECDFDFLIEGAQSRSAYRFLSGASTQIMHNCNFQGYNTHARGAYFSTDTAGAGAMVLYGGEIHVSSHTVNATLPLVTAGSEGEFAFYAGVDMFYPNRAGILPTSYTAFRTILGCSSDGLNIDRSSQFVNGGFSDDADGPFNPTIFASVGTITTASGVGSYVRYLGKMVFVSFKITIPNNGTGSSALRANLPVNASANGNWVLNGRSHALGGQQLQGLILEGFPTFVTIWTDDNTYPAVDGETIYLSGWYEAA